MKTKFKICKRAVVFSQKVINLALGMEEFDFLSSTSNPFNSSYVSTYLPYIQFYYQAYWKFHRITFPVYIHFNYHKSLIFFRVRDKNVVSEEKRLLHSTSCLPRNPSINWRISCFHPVKLREKFYNFPMNCYIKSD